MPDAKLTILAGTAVVVVGGKGEGGEVLSSTTVSEGKYAYWAWPALVTHSFFALTVCMQGHYYYLVV